MRESVTGPSDIKRPLKLAKEREYQTTRNIHDSFSSLHTTC